MADVLDAFVGGPLRRLETRESYTQHVCGESMDCLYAQLHTSSHISKGVKKKKKKSLSLTTIYLLFFSLFFCVIFGK